MSDVDAFIRAVRGLYRQPEGALPLHAPTLGEREKALVSQAIDSTYVSSVGRFVTVFEQQVADYVGARYAVATVNGTAALHTALQAVGVTSGDLVLTQALTFVATANAIRYCGADPVFLDVDASTLGLSPAAVDEWLTQHAVRRDDGVTVHRTSGRVVRACVPMHTLGHPVRIDALVHVCDAWGVTVVEDAAEALGSRYQGRHVGTFGRLGVFSFNGNKIITTGGGGMVVTNDEALACRARHLTTTAKRPHPWAFEHDEVGYNYRMPNLNAALGVAQMERLDDLLARKRTLALRYAALCDSHGWSWIDEPPGARSNFWLCGLMLPDVQTRDHWLGRTNEQQIGTRPLWTPMHRLPMYQHCLRDALTVTEEWAARVLNVPSTPPPQ